MGWQDCIQHISSARFFALHNIRCFPADTPVVGQAHSRYTYVGQSSNFYFLTISYMITRILKKYIWAKIWIKQHSMLAAVCDCWP